MHAHTHTQRTNSQTNYLKSNENRFHGLFGLWPENSIDLPLNGTTAINVSQKLWIAIRTID